MRIMQYHPMKSKTTFFSFSFFLVFSFFMSEPGLLPYTKNTKNCACEIYMPNVFSPNNDKVNDEFTASIGTSCSVSQFNLKVFDRFGALVFESSDLDKGWDGSYKGQGPIQGAYAFVVQYKLSEELGKAPRIVSGIVQLVK